MLWNNTAAISRTATASIPRHTPDLCQLEQYEQHLLFDYAPIDATKFSPACTADDQLTMFQCSRERGTPPLVLKIGTHVFSDINRAKIGGALHQISTEHLIFLDKQRENLVLSQRKRVKIILPDFYKGYTHVKVEAWMYLGEGKRWIEDVLWNKSFFRCGGGDYEEAPVYRDSRDFIGSYFEYEPRVATPRKINILYNPKYLKEA